MKCESIRAQLTAYLDGELGDDRGSAVRGHLRGCEGCRQVAADEAALRDGLRTLPSLEPPASLWAGVQRQLAAAEVADAERPAWRRVLARWTPRAPQLAFASVAVAAAIILIVMRMQQSDDEAPAKPPRVAEPQQTIIAPSPAPAPAPAQQEGDVSAELAAAPAKVTQDYAQAALELEELAKEARARWTDEQKRQYDAQVLALRGEIVRAKEERPRQKAYRSLIRYLQRAAIRDDVALASTGGTP